MDEKLKKRRLNNYDLLRMICSFGVILIHVSAVYINKIESFENTFAICLYNGIGRFAVPIFLMLTGTFLLNNPKNKDFKYFYNKYLKKLYIQTLIFSVLYIIYRVLKLFFENENPNINELIEDLLIGKPFYHMWYMYMLIIVYLLIPFVIRFKDEIGEKNFFKFSIIYLPIAMICLQTSEFKIQYNPGMAILYLSYVLIGYSISNLKYKFNTIKSCFFIIMSFLIEIFLALFISTNVENLKSNLQLYAPSSFIVCISSICLYIGFSNLKIEKDFSFLSNLTIYIYLIHAGVLEATYKIFAIILKNYTNINSIIIIPFFSIIVFICSGFIAYLCDIMLKKFLIKREDYAQK